MMSVGLHCRLVGRPGAGGQRWQRFNRLRVYVSTLDRCGPLPRIDIAEHWMKTTSLQSARPAGLAAKAREAFSSAPSAVIYEHFLPGSRSGAFELGTRTGPPIRPAACTMRLPRPVFRVASEEERLGVLRTHPAGRQTSRRQTA